MTLFFQNDVKIRELSEELKEKSPKTLTARLYRERVDIFLIVMFSSGRQMILGEVRSLETKGAMRETTIFLSTLGYDAWGRWRKTQDGRKFSAERYFRKGN